MFAERTSEGINRRLAFLAPIGGAAALAATLEPVEAVVRPTGLSVTVRTRFGRGVKNTPDGIWSVRKAPCSQEVDMFSGKPFGTDGSVEVYERILLSGTQSEASPGTVGVLGSRDFTECLKK